MGAAVAGRSISGNREEFFPPLTLPRAGEVRKSASAQSGADARFRQEALEALNQAMMEQLRLIADDAPALAAVLAGQQLVNRMLRGVGADCFTQEVESKDILLEVVDNVVKLQNKFVFMKVIDKLTPYPMRLKKGGRSALDVPPSENEVLFLEYVQAEGQFLRVWHDLASCIRQKTGVCADVTQKIQSGVAINVRSVADVMHSGFAYPSNQNLRESSLLLAVFREHLCDCVKMLMLKLLRQHGPVEGGTKRFEFFHNTQRRENVVGVAVVDSASGRYAVNKINAINDKLVVDVLTAVACKLSASPEAAYAKKFVEVAQAVREGDSVEVASRFQAALQEYFRQYKPRKSAAARRAIEILDPAVFFEQVFGQEKEKG